MRTVLVVDSDSSSRQRLVDGMARCGNDLRVLSAAHGGQAAQLLNETEIDVLVTELDMPVMDGFELMALLVQDHPAVEIVVMGHPASGRIRQALSVSADIHYLAKPVSPRALSDLVRQGTSASTRGHITGLSLWSLLQLLSSEERSCSLIVHGQEKKGEITLVKGEVFDAHRGMLNGKAALYELLSWSQPEIEVREAPISSARRIQAPLAKLLLEASSRSDEKAWLEQADEKGDVDDEASASPASLLDSPQGFGMWLTQEQQAAIAPGLEDLIELPGALAAAVINLGGSGRMIRIRPSAEESLTAAIESAADQVRAKLKDHDEDHAGTSPFSRMVFSPQRFELHRVVRSLPSVLLYFAGDLIRVSAPEAGAKLEDLEELIEAQLAKAPTAPAAKTDTKVFPASRQ